MGFPVYPSDLHLNVHEANLPLIENGTPSKAINEHHLFCSVICGTIGHIITLSSFFWLLQLVNDLYIPELPSVSLESMSFTFVNIVSGTQVTSNLEVVFRMENNYENVTHYHINALAFHIKEINMGSFMGQSDIVEVKQLIANATVAPFEQYGKDDKWLRVRMDGVVVDVDYYEQQTHGRYGVSYLTFGLRGFISAEGEGKPLKRTSSMRAMCDGKFKVVFSWNGAPSKCIPQPPMECQVHGQWHTLHERFGIVLVILHEWFGIVLVLVVHNHFPELPSVLLKFMSLTFVNIAFDTQVTTNLEAIFLDRKQLCITTLLTTMLMLGFPY
ncbi:hypothetical protein FEM48_Zijuj07G0010400 [Ziziphus jujuba var. spinosa]|uniref:Uncharacterized protein n=1 Tax=Ziziphus jujuba var. spinosa TaxID=714518 RepID=A0A978V1J0_ZIZJJ|nr:hypothetical protein FEM48_Zijuj07G0010400 [Ziziphus jujuba var. spinosa]